MIGNKQSSIKSAVAILESLHSVAMDSVFENAIVYYLRNSNAEETWKIVQVFLTHPDIRVRTLGLRVVRRHFKDPELLQQVIKLCFCVERLPELQLWYFAILARYPLMKFLSMLISEATCRADTDFVARHTRAFQMHRMDGCKKKKAAWKRLMAFSARSDFISRGVLPFT